MQWRLIRDAETLELSDRAPYDVVSVDNVGLGPVRRLTERGPFQVGVSDAGYRFDARVVNLVVVSMSDSKALADGARDDLFWYLRPADDSFVLQCTRDDGALRQLDVHATNIVDAPINEDDRMSGFQRYALQLMAAFPFWYDPEFGYWVVLGGSDPEQGGTNPNQTNGYEVPTAVPTITVEASGIDYSFPVEYAGTADSFPLITIYGPASGVVIENTTAGAVLSLPNLAISAGEYIEIDLAFDAKTIVDDEGANQIAELATTSDIVTWRLVPGTNDIRFTVGSGATEDTGMKITYRIQYISL